MKTFVFSLFLCFSAFASSKTNFDHSHGSFERILKDVVVYDGKQSLVKYNDLKKSPRALNVYLSSLSAVSKSDFDSWKADDRLAFLINAYNAFTLKLIIDGYPTKSIKDLGSFLKSPWKKKFFKLFGKETHLDDVEHVMIRKNFDEPRIHFAVVCASIGCPPLHDFAFTGKELNKQLEKATKFFLEDKNKNSYNKKKNKLSLSKIFKWYGDDFKNKHGSFVKFVSPYLGVTTKDPKVSWKSYDWGLNEKK